MLNLDLDKNRLRFIGPGTFVTLTNINTLILSENYLELIDPGAFSANNSRLVELHLNNNHFYNCSKLGLTYLNNLTTLNLGYNYLKTAKDCVEIIGKLTSLKSLLLTFNQFESIKFTNALENINSLDLSYLSLSTFELDTNKKDQLESLNINYNRIEELRFDKKGQLDNLKYLLIGFNKISKIDSQFFGQIPNLFTLDLI